MYLNLKQKHARMSIQLHACSVHVYSYCILNILNIQKMYVWFTQKNLSRRMANKHFFNLGLIQVFLILFMIDLGFSKFVHASSTFFLNFFMLHLHFFQICSCFIYVFLSQHFQKCTNAIKQKNATHQYLHKSSISITKLKNLIDKAINLKIFDILFMTGLFLYESLQK